MVARLHLGDQLPHARIELRVRRGAQHDTHEGHALRPDGEVGREQQIRAEVVEGAGLDAVDAVVAEEAVAVLDDADVVDLDRRGRHDLGDRGFGEGEFSEAQQVAGTRLVPRRRARSVR